MSGHNKWSTIKQKKGKSDAARAKVFTKIGRELIVAIKDGGSADPSVNSNSRIVLQKQRLQMYLTTTLKESSRKRQAMQIQQTTRLLHMRATVQTALP